MVLYCSLPTQTLFAPPTSSKSNKISVLSPPFSTPTMLLRLRHGKQYFPRVHPGLIEIPETRYPRKQFLRFGTTPSNMLTVSADSLYNVAPISLPTPSLPPSVSPLQVLPSQILMDVLSLVKGNRIFFEDTDSYNIDLRTIKANVKAVDFISTVIFTHHASMSYITEIRGTSHRVLSSDFTLMRSNGLQYVHSPPCVVKVGFYGFKDGQIADSR